MRLDVADLKGVYKSSATEVEDFSLLVTQCKDEA
jgi:hypothetical protein